MPGLVIVDYTSQVEGYPTCQASVRATVENQGSAYACYRLELEDPWGNKVSRVDCVGIGQQKTTVVPFRIPTYSDNPYTYTLRLVNEDTDEVEDEKSVTVITKRPGDGKPRYELINAYVTPAQPKVGQALAIVGVVQNPTNNYAEQGAMLDINFRGEYKQARVYPCPEGVQHGGASWVVNEPGTYSATITMYNMDDTSQPPQRRTITFTVTDGDGDGGEDGGGEEGGGETGGAEGAGYMATGSIMIIVLVSLFVLVIVMLIKEILGGKA